MDSLIEEHRITNVAALERLYGAPAGAAVEKEIVFFAILLWLVIVISYLVWTLFLVCIPDSVWDELSGS